MCDLYIETSVILSDVRNMKHAFECRNYYMLVWLRKPDQSY